LKYQRLTFVVLLPLLLQLASLLALQQEVRPPADHNRGIGGKTFDTPKIGLMDILRLYSL
jgi:hypothetical protein